MPRSWVTLRFEEHRGGELERCRFFGVLPLCESPAPGLERLDYSWGSVWGLSQEGRRQFYEFTYYRPSEQAAKDYLLRYALARVLEKRGYTLLRRLGEVLSFLGPAGEEIWVAIRWKGYTPLGIKRLYKTTVQRDKRKPDRFLYSPAPKRRFHYFNHNYNAEPLPEDLWNEAIGFFEALVQSQKT